LLKLFTNLMHQQQPQQQQQGVFLRLLKRIFYLLKMN